MSLRALLTPTAVARPGMTVGALFAECVRTQVPGLPYEDGDGVIRGKASIRHVLKVHCLPDYLVRHSHLLGDDIEHLQFPEINAREIMARPIDEFVVADYASIGVASPVSKVLARMEQHDTTYIFVFDPQRQYLGALTIIRLADYLRRGAAPA